MGRVLLTPPDKFASPLEQWKWYRQAARVDLVFLCRNILGYRDVSREVHGDIVDNLQKFSGGEDEGNQCYQDGRQYKPFIPYVWDLGGPKQTLNLIPRGHLKTSLVTVAHTIQWIINYRYIRIHLMSANLDLAESFLDGIKQHFVANDVFRSYFPEYCPQGKDSSKFGNNQEMTIPNRFIGYRGPIPKEPTISVSSIEAPKAGPHFEVLKADDLVVPGNVETKGQIEKIKNNFALIDAMVERQETRIGSVSGWIDLVGTRYDFNDLYGLILQEHKDRLSKEEYEELISLNGEARKAKEREYAEAKRKAKKREWSVVVKSAAPNWPKGPTLWPGRWGIEELQRIYDDPSKGPAYLASQFLMNPVPVGTGLLESQDDIWWVPGHVIDKLYPTLALYTAVDLAGMEQTKGNDNDFTSITTGGYGRDGRLYVLEVWRGRPKPDEVISYLFDLYKRRPLIKHIKVEKENHARVLLPFLKGEQERRGVWLPIIELQRDNQQSKIHKLKGLQPWLNAKRIGFDERLVAKQAIIDEVMRFPKFHDDTLDNLRDLMDDGDGGVISDVIARPKPIERPSYTSNFIGFIEGGEDVWDSMMPVGNGCDPMTGL